MRFIAALAIGIAAHVNAATLPPGLGKHDSRPDDRRAIEAVLASYTRCVSTSDEAGFRTLLLSDDIPFASVGRKSGAQSALDTRHYDGFRQAVFGSGRHFQQSFHNIRIEQDGPLAQASLDFVTTDTADGSSGYGWKVLQLIKSDGQWKIASELYTVRSAD